MKRLLTFGAALLLMGSGTTFAAKVNTEKRIDVDGRARMYVLYVPDKVGEHPALVFSLHGAAGHDTDRSPMSTAVADNEGFIVVYPQGLDQYFPVFGGMIPGWNSTGEANEDLDFFKAVIEAVGADYDIDRSRIYCCGFSNGGMMTYSNTSSASDIFAAFASISGFQLNEFHLRATGYRPVPFLHIHGKADDFVKYSCMPTICDQMVARNGCCPVPEVEVVDGRYRRSVYTAGEGGFPYIYYEIDDMGHSPYTDRTPEGDSSLTMWRFLSQYTLDDACDSTLKWRLNIDAPGFDPTKHNWKVDSARKRFEYGRPGKANNADNNVYPSLQLEAGEYAMDISSEGAEGHNIYVCIEPLGGGEPLVSKAVAVGTDATIALSVPAYEQYKLTIVKDKATDRIQSFAIHSRPAPATDANCQDAQLPEPESTTDKGTLIEIPQDQGTQYDDFARTEMKKKHGYIEYTATGDLQIAFKMMDIDVADCDYVMVKFNAPVEAGWHLAFWEGTDLTPVPAGVDEYVFELEPAMLISGRLPQICLMTYFGGYTAPLIAKVKGVYKHSTNPDGIASISGDGASPAAYVSLSGHRSGRPTPGVNIVEMTDGTVSKVMIRQ